MKKIIFAAILAPLFFIACSVSYKFNGASIDYSKIKTMEIHDFINQAPMVYPPLAIEFNDKLKDIFSRNTKLSFTNNGGDVELEGEIVRYDISPLAVKEDGYASQTRLTITVRMRYRNNVDPEEDKEESITAYRDFDSSNMLSDVQDELIKQISEEIADQIFNTTMSNW